MQLHFFHQIEGKVQLETQASRSYMLLTKAAAAVISSITGTVQSSTFGLEPPRNIPRYEALHVHFLPSAPLFESCGAVTRGDTDCRVAESGF